MQQNLRSGVVTAACGRFHMFDQARELVRNGLLHTLITDYPRSHSAAFGVPPERVRPLLFNGIVKYGIQSLPLPGGVRSGLARGIHSAFSRRVSGMLPPDMRHFIGLSSFSLEALQVCRERGVTCAVDHGSLHQRLDRDLVLEEARRWGVEPPQDTSPQWLIDKQDREFGLADQVYVLSSAAARSLVRAGIRSDKLFVNPCGVDVSTFAPGSKPDGTFRVLQVGAISLRKGVLDLLEAFRMARLVEAQLTFVGGGLAASGLTHSIAAQSVGDVEFLEPVPQAQLRHHYHRSSVFVLASIADGFGMVVPQAMACGLPVIVTENVGASDLVRDGVNGFIVPIRSPHLIAERLRQLRDDTALARRMGEAAASTVRSGHTWADYGARLASFLTRSGAGDR